MLARVRRGLPDVLCPLALGPHLDGLTKVALEHHLAQDGVLVALREGVGDALRSRQLSDAGVGLGVPEALAEGGDVDRHPLVGHLGATPQGVKSGSCVEDHVQRPSICTHMPVFQREGLGGDLCAECAQELAVLRAMFAAATCAASELRTILLIFVDAESTTYESETPSRISASATRITNPACEQPRGMLPRDAPDAARKIALGGLERRPPMRHRRCRLAVRRVEFACSVGTTRGAEGDIVAPILCGVVETADEPPQGHELHLGERVLIGAILGDRDTLHILQVRLHVDRDFEVIFLTQYAAQELCAVGSFHVDSRRRLWSSFHTVAAPSVLAASLSSTWSETSALNEGAQRESWSHMLNTHSTKRDSRKPSSTVMVRARWY